MERFNRVYIFRRKSNTFQGITYFPVFTKTTEIFCTIFLVNKASFWGGRWFVLTQAHLLSVFLQMVKL